MLVKVGVATDVRPLEKIEHHLESINHKLRLVAGAEVLKALFHLTEGFGHGALELMNTASAAGLTTDAMQRLQFAVAQSGGNAAELGMTMTHLARMIHGAKMGAQDALETFYLLGISQRQIASFKTTEDVLYGVMEALQKIQDPLKRQALMDRALGQGSRALGRFALDGKAAALASQATARRIGALVPRGTLERLGEAKASLSALGMMFHSVGSTVAGLFAPVIVRVVQQIEDFYVANKKVINQSFHDWVVSAARAFGVFTAIVEVVGGAIARFVDKHSDMIGTVFKIASAVSAYSAAVWALKGAFSVLQPAYALASGVLTIAPYVLAATGVGILTASIRDLWHYLTTGDTEDMWLIKIFDAAGKFFSTGAIGEMVQGGMEGIADGLKQLGINVRPEVSTGVLRNAPGADISRQIDQVSRLQTFVPPIAMPGLQSIPTGPSPVTMNTTNNINVPPGVTPEQTKQAVTAAVRDTRVRELEQALRAQSQSFAY